MQRRDFIGSGSALIALALMSNSASASAESHSPAPTPRAIQPITLKNIVIGAGEPKIIVSTTASHSEAVKEFVQQQAKRPEPAVIELRLDQLDNSDDAAAMVQLTRELYAILPDKLLLVTFRTKAEGGNQAIDDQRYAALYHQLLIHGQMDLLDIEMYRGTPQVEQLIALAHQQGVHVILSSHDFQQTPSQAEIISRLRQQQAMGADILKIAAMPHDAGDVLRMMSATWEMAQRYAQRPLLTMSMGGMGALSRLAGELTGSALTFGMAGSASAPGQLDVGDLSATLAMLHSSLSSEKPA